MCFAAGGDLEVCQAASHIGIFLTCWFIVMGSEAWGLGKRV